jgi:hypothetical protein
VLRRRGEDEQSPLTTKTHDIPDVLRVLTQLGRSCEVACNDAEIAKVAELIRWKRGYTGQPELITDDTTTAVRTNLGRRPSANAYWGVRAEIAIESRIVA